MFEGDEDGWESRVEVEEVELAAEDAARSWCAGRLFAATSSSIAVEESTSHTTSSHDSK